MTFIEPMKPGIAAFTVALQVLNIPTKYRQGGFYEEERPFVSCSY